MNRTIPESSMNRLRFQRRTAIPLGLMILIITLGVMYYFALGRSPLAGEMSHDFGIVPVELGGTRIEHIFVLRNRTNKNLVITDVKTSCGCAVADLSSRELGPGESVSITAALKLTTSRLKKESILLLLQGLGGRQISLTAQGRQVEKLRSDDAFIIAPIGEDTRYQFYADLWEEDSRSPPTVFASQGVRVTLEEWKETRAGIPREGRPAAWVAVLLVHPAPDAIEPREVRITLDDGYSLTLPLRDK